MVCPHMLRKTTSGANNRKKDATLPAFLSLVKWLISKAEIAADARTVLSMIAWFIDSIFNKKTTYVADWQALTDEASFLATKT